MHEGWCSGGLQMLGRATSRAGARWACVKAGARHQAGPIAGLMTAHQNHYAHFRVIERSYCRFHSDFGITLENS